MTDNTANLAEPVSARLSGPCLEWMNEQIKSAASGECWGNTLAVDPGFLTVHHHHSEAPLLSMQFAPHNEVLIHEVKTSNISSLTSVSNKEAELTCWALSPVRRTCANTQTPLSSVKWEAMESEDWVHASESFSSRERFASCTQILV